MIDRIIVPINFSDMDSAAKSLEYASVFCDKFGSDLHLLNVYTGLSKLITQNSTEIEDTLLKDNKLKSFSQLESIAQKLPIQQERIYIHSRKGAVHSEILSLADEIKSDLIIISSEFYSYFKSLIHSNTTKVFLNSKCSVLIAKDDF